jgi:hypothetical protein
MAPYLYIYTNITDLENEIFFFSLYLDQDYL